MRKLIAMLLVLSLLLAQPTQFSAEQVSVKDRFPLAEEGFWFFYGVNSSGSTISLLGNMTASMNITIVNVSETAIITREHLVFYENGVPFSSVVVNNSWDIVNHNYTPIFLSTIDLNRSLTEYIAIHLGYRAVINNETGEITLIEKPNITIYKDTVLGHNFTIIAVYGWRSPWDYFSVKFIKENGLLIESVFITYTPEKPNMTLLGANYEKYESMKLQDTNAFPEPEETTNQTTETPVGNETVIEYKPKPLWYTLAPYLALALIVAVVVLFVWVKRRR